MKKEWAWRVSRGESTRNLAAFEKVLSGEDNEFLGTFDDSQTQLPETTAIAGSPRTTSEDGADEQSAESSGESDRAQDEHGR